MKILTVVGNRPQFIKSAPLSFALREAGSRRSSSTRDSTTTARCRRSSSRSSACRARATARPPHRRPGRDDAAHHRARSAPRPRPRARLRRHELDPRRRSRSVATSIPLVHVEAGLRSGDLTMPEEHTRIEVDRIAWLLFCPDDLSQTTLTEEGVLGPHVRRRRRDGGRRRPLRADRARAVPRALHRRGATSSRRSTGRRTSSSPGSGASSSG